MRGEPEMGMEIVDNIQQGAIGPKARFATFSPRPGWFGNAQIGPIYLGWAGV